MLTALALALAKAGRSNPARMAIMAMTTSNSIKVKARHPGRLSDWPGFAVIAFLSIVAGRFGMNPLAVETRRFPQLNSPQQMVLSEVRSNGLAQSIGGCSLLVAMGWKLSLGRAATKSAILPTGL